MFDSLLHFRDLGFITVACCLPCQEASVLVILYGLISEASSFKVDEIFLFGLREITHVPVFYTSCKIYLS